jgi:glutaredoxin
VNVTSRPLLTVYLAPECHLCHDALTLLGSLQAELGFDLEECDITRDDTLHRAYLERIPVVVLEDEELFEYFVDPDILRARLGAERVAAGPGARASDPGSQGSPR